MMNGPLNAFPWVINGFVEAMVSVKRIGKYLDLEATDRSLSFDDVYDEIEPEVGGAAAAAAAVDDQAASAAVICLKDASFSPSGSVHLVSRIFFKDEGRAVGRLVLIRCIPYIVMVDS